MSSKIEQSSQIGIERLFGLPFALIGYGVLLVPVMSGEWAALLFTVPFGGIFAAAGTWIMFGRNGWTLDRETNKLHSWWGILGYRKETTRDLGDFKELSLSQERRGSSKNRYTCYPVQLRGGADKFEFAAPRSHHAARAQAERVAKCLQLGIHDSSGGETVFRDYQDLDETLLDRYKRTGTEKEMPTPLTSARSTLSVEGDSLVFKIPGTSLGCVLGLWMFLGTIFLGPVLGAFLSSGKSVDTGVLGVFALVVLPPLALLVYRSSLATRPRRLEISRQGVTLEQEGKARTIPLEQLEEIEIGTAGYGLRGIAARSDHEALEVQCQLSDEELNWIRDNLHWFIASLARQG